MPLVAKWCPRTDSNRGPIDYKSIALPAELQGQYEIYKLKVIICNTNKNVILDVLIIVTYIL